MSWYVCMSLQVLHNSCILPKTSVEWLRRESWLSLFRLSYKFRLSYTCHRLGNTCYYLSMHNQQWVYIHCLDITSMMTHHLDVALIVTLHLYFALMVLQYLDDVTWVVIYCLSNIMSQKHPKQNKLIFNVLHHQHLFPCIWINNNSIIMTQNNNNLNYSLVYFYLYMLRP